MIERMREQLPSALTVALALHRSEVCFKNRVVDLGSRQIDCDIHCHPCSLFVTASAWWVGFEDDQGRHASVSLGSRVETIVANLANLAEVNSWS